MSQSQLSQNDLDIIFNWIATIMQGGPVSAVFNMSSINITYIREFSQEFLKELKNALLNSSIDFNYAEYSKLSELFKYQSFDLAEKEVKFVLLNLFICNETGPFKNDRISIAVERKFLHSEEEVLLKEESFYKLYKTL